MFRTKSLLSSFPSLPPNSLTHPLLLFSTFLHLSNSLLPLSRSFTTRFPHPTLCYRPPTFVYPFFSRTIVSSSHTSYEPHGSSASPVWDLRRRWVMLIVCTETEPAPTCVLSPPFYRKFLSPIFHSQHVPPNIQQHRVPIPLRRSHGRNVPCTDPLLRFVIPFTPYTLCLCVPFENPHAFFSALHLVPRL